MEAFNIPKYIKNDKSFPFWYSMLIETKRIIDFNKVNKILDFGSGNGKFLHLLNHLKPDLNLTGIEIDEDLLEFCANKAKENMHFEKAVDLGRKCTRNFDLIFSQEVVYTIPCLLDHAKTTFSLLRGGGHYIFTMGCHVNNPTWKNRKEAILSEESYPAHDYSAEDIASAFFTAGYRVSVKRLPVHYPLKYVPHEKGEFKSVNDLLTSTEEHKLLFVMLKPRE
tara:strand:+ start:2817 stop:3485 length:669 start_codon:yes stop_codon:yes gene_type:complete